MVVAVVLLLAGCAGDDSGGPSNPTPGAQRSAGAVAYVVPRCSAPSARPTVTATGPRTVPHPQAESPEAAVARCAADLARTLADWHTNGLHHPETLRGLLVGAGLQRVELEPVDGGATFGGRVGAFCVYGTHSTARTVVDHGYPMEYGGCLR